MPAENKTALTTRLHYLDTVQMWDGLHRELGAVVKRAIEPAIRERVISKNALTLRASYRRSSMAYIFDDVRMPFAQTNEDSLGSFLRVDGNTVLGLFKYLNSKKLKQDEIDGWANTGEYSYLCDCIDLMKYIDRLIKIGDETQSPVSYQQVFCLYCYRYAEGKEIGSTKNLKLCKACREVEGDGQDYKEAKRRIERYAKISKISSSSIWLDLKKRQAAEMNNSSKDLRHLASTEGLSPEARFKVTVELIKQRPRLKAALLGKALAVISLAELIDELLRRMDFRYSGINDYFQAHPEHLCGILIRYDCYLLIEDSLDKSKAQTESKRKSTVNEIKDLLTAGLKVSAIIKKLGYKRSTVYKLIKENELVIKKKN